MFAMATDTTTPKANDERTNEEPRRAADRAGSALGSGGRARLQRRRLVLLFSVDHRHLLPAVLPPAPRQAGPCPFPSDPRRGGAGGLSSVQTLQAGATSRRAGRP